jgi:UDP-N-acetyl-D-mannosaminuronic acid transferase (WecB/TagA/CpsF family)
VRHAGFEWLYRLAIEPRRLFRRYVIGNPLFIARALRLAAQTLRHERGAAT